MSSVTMGFMDESTEQPSLAEQRADVTREAIIRATQNLLIREHPASLSVPAVAAEAGVSVRTVYRYFPNKQALLDGTANYFPDKAMGLGRRVFDNIADSEDALVNLWTSFGENIPAVRAEHQSPAGSELRQRRLTETRTQMAKYVADQFPDTADHDREVFTDLLIAVTSSSMFLELTDRLGHDAESSARLAMWAAKALAKEFATKKGLS